MNITKFYFFVMSFTTITKDLQRQLKSNLPQIQFLLKKNPAMGYTKIIQVGHMVGEKYKIKLVVNFPERGKIDDFASYGTQDLSIIIDKDKKKFPIDRSEIKSKAKELLGDIKIEDAYMYEGKEGVKAYYGNGKIDILPHSLHIWCKFTPEVTEFCDWLLLNVYELKQ